MNAWVRIIRPINGVMGIIATLVSGLIGVGLRLPDYYIEISMAAIAVLLVTSGGNIINDVVDIETDRLNHPERPLVTGRISVKSARTAAVALFLAALLISGAFISFLSVAVVALAEVFLILYEFKTKKLGFSGNVMISILVGLIFVFGGIAVHSVRSMAILFAMASLANLSREIIKDIQDMGGDIDRQTLPKVYGVKISAGIATAAILVAVVLSYLPYYLGIFRIYYLLPVAISDALFIFSASTIIQHPETSQKISKIAMIVGLASFAAGGIL